MESKLKANTGARRQMPFPLGRDTTSLRLSAVNSGGKARLLSRVSIESVKSGAESDAAARQILRLRLRMTSKTKALRAEYREPSTEN